MNLRFNLFFLIPILLCFFSNADDKTQVSPHSKAEIRQGWNEVYCPTFQMAWDSFNDEIIKGKIRLNKSQTLADILNGSPYRTDNLTPESFFAKSAVIEKDHSLKPDLIKEFIAKFGEQGNEDVLKDCRDMVDKASPLPGFLAFAYLEKFLAFSTPFYVFKTPLRFSEGNSKTLTESFGISVNDCDKTGKRNNITIGDYIDPDNFILILDANSINRKTWEEVKKVNPEDNSIPEPPENDLFEDLPPGSDEIILAKVPPQKTLEESWELVKTQIQNSKANKGLKDEEKVQIPKVHMDLSKKYQELHGAGLLNPGFEQFLIADTLQVIKFDLNEKGAELRSYAMVFYAGASGIPNIATPRSFILDKPFLMVLRQKGKEPYLMCWFANSELLKKWKPDDKLVDFFEKGKNDALSDISAGKNFYMVDKCGNVVKPETSEDLRQLIMKRDFGLDAKITEDSLKGDFRDDYIEGYNEIALGAVGKKMSVKFPEGLETRTKNECEKIRMLNSPASILLSLLKLQNPDGSWGNSEKTRLILTSLGTLVLLGHGETYESEFFGKTLRKSIAFLSENTEKRFLEFTPAEKALVTLTLSEAWIVIKMQELEKPAKFATKIFLESEPTNLDAWNVLALISVSKNYGLCDKDKSAKFAEKLKSLEGSEIARVLLEDKLFEKVPDDARIDKFIDDLNCNWDDLSLRDVEDTFALMILALQASNKDVWKKCNKKVVSYLVKRRTTDEKEMLAYYPAKWKTDEMLGVKFDERDALLLSSISGSLISFVYFRYAPIFKHRPVKK